MNRDRLAPLAGRYRLLAVVGRGGMGTVWRAHDEVLDRDVAIKEIRFPRRITESERRVRCRRLLSEARATAALRHPGVVAVHDVVVAEDRPWIVMEFVEARSLNRRVAEQGPLGVRRTAEVGAAVLAVLRASHAAGILHRDVKPSNVLLTEDGRVLLTDFGLAVHMQNGQTVVDTMPAGIEGSPAYLPPERVNGEPGEEASDLWSLGATLYLAVEGFSPFLRCHALASMVAVLLGDYARPSRAGPLTPVIEGLLRQRPQDRLTAEATAELLREVAGTVPEPGITRAAVRGRRPWRGPRVPWALPGGPAAHGARRRPDAGRRLRPGTLLGVTVIAALAAGAGTWTARWTAIGKSDAVAVRPAADVTARTARYHRAGAYSVRVPADWRAERNGDAVVWTDPGARRGLRIVPASGDPLAGLRAAERAAVAERRYPGYRRLRLESVPEVAAGAAEWEFTWDGRRPNAGEDGRHMLCRRASGYEFCLYAPDSAWTPGQRLYDRVLKSFRPERGG